YPDSDRAVVEAVTRIAEARGVPRAQLALSWLLRQGTVTAPIIGASKPRHLQDAVAAVELNLTEKESEELEQPYTPHAVSGH
ncbi:aldo/keto reductase, partial [Streptomyces turgidiscabies]